jgi:hypothetical protein
VHRARHRRLARPPESSQPVHPRGRPGGGHGLRVPEVKEAVVDADEAHDEDPGQARLHLPEGEEQVALSCSRASRTSRRTLLN